MALRPHPRLVSLAMLFAQIAIAQQIETFRSSLDDAERPYVLYLPKPLDPARRYPLVFALHGEFSDPRLELRRLFGGRAPDRVDSIVACPSERIELGEWGIIERDIYDALADIQRRFPIDNDRIYLTGDSSGGGGALWLALTRPDMWAAVAAVAPEIPPEAEDLAPNALNLPLRLYHGDQDPAVPVAQSRRWQKRFLDLGIEAEYIEYPGVLHNAWSLAYKDGAIFDWFAKFRRAAHPPRVRFQTHAYKYDAAYWVRLDSFTPGELASIDARLSGNKVEISTSNIDGFTLRLAPPLAVTIDGTPLRVRAGAASFERTARGWRAGLTAPAPGDKQPGAEGPISEAIASRHIYVYGTADSPGPAELSRREQIARMAAMWSQPDPHPALSFPVKADAKIQPQDLEQSNLVLFGTKESNSIIARLAARLPLALNPGAADYGLVFVASTGKHDVVIDSGLPWWTGADQVNRPPMHGATPPPFRVLETFGDFILFKGSLENVVAEGRFDRHWKLPAAAADAIKVTGTVVIQ
jgi:Phospholipase/Carboxylesterase